MDVGSPPSARGPKLPNVLPIGDSITPNYYSDVVQKLAYFANVYLFASSTALGNPRLPGQLAEFWSMQGVRLQGIHLSNGLHDWSYSEAQYGGALPSFLSEVRNLAPEARLVWTTSTAVRDDSATGATNSRIDARNNIATAFFAKRGIPIDDQYRLMLDRCKDYQDPAHFNGTGSAIQAAQVTETIQDQLAEK